MRKPLILLVLAAVGGCGWFFLQQYRIDGLERLKLRPRDGSVEADNAPDDPGAEKRSGPSASARISCGTSG